MESLLELLKGQLTPEVMQQASRISGENPANTKTAIDALAPTLLHAFADKGSTAAGAGQLLGALSDSKIDGGMLGNFASLLGGGGSSQLLSAGSALLPMLLGGKSSGILDTVASMAGVKSGSTSMLGSIVSMLIGGLISKQVASGGLNAAGLASMLGSQKGLLASALPKGIGDMLGVGNMAASAAAGVKDAVGGAASGMKDAVGGAASGVKGAVGGAASGVRDTVGGAASAARNTAATATEAAKSGGSSMLRWLLPLLAVAALAYLAYTFLAPRTPNLAVVACGPIASIDAAVSGNMPVISSDTKVSDVKVWLATLKPGVDALVTAGNAAGLPVSGISDAFGKLSGLVDAVTTDTLGGAADSINTAIGTFKTAQGGLKTTAGCK